jgi:hypothetical protein
MNARLVTFTFYICRQLQLYLYLVTRSTIAHIVTGSVHTVFHSEHNLLVVPKPLTRALAALVGACSFTSRSIGGSHVAIMAPSNRFKYFNADKHTTSNLNVQHATEMT